MLKAIKAKRLTLNLTQKELASRLGLTQPTYCNIEKGLRNPSLSTLMKLADILDCTVDELLRDGGEEEEDDDTGVKRVG